MDWWYKPGYYRPVDSPNRAAMNSFVVNPKNKTVYAFQFTVAEEHDVKAGGMQWLESTYPEYERHYFVFSDNDHINVLVQKSYDHIWTSRWYVRVGENQLFREVDIGEGGGANSLFGQLLKALFMGNRR
ncbi:hypothetical protein C8Q75DRAFT_432777 [Abortiporus biennis]|nr:hypothetical protein C8Q75DRAFT_432777 [Abortiporus biennis]